MPTPTPPRKAEDRVAPATALLPQSLALLEQVLDHVPQAIGWKDRDARFLGCNQAFARAVGLAAPTEIVGRLDQELTWGGHAADFLHTGDRLLLEQQQPSYRAEVSLLTTEVPPLWLIVRKQPLHDETGNIIGILIEIEDVTEQKYAEQLLQQSHHNLKKQLADQTVELDQINWDLQALLEERQQTEIIWQENEARLRFVLESIPVMMDAFDAEGNIIMWNSECERVTGFRAAEIIFNPNALEMLYPDSEYRAHMLQEWARLGNNFRNWEWDIGCKDGSRKTILWSNLSEEFPIPGWASWGIGIDISDRKQAEEALRQSEQQLREQAQRERLINQLINQIRNSLDFDTILETILQGIQTLLETDRCQFAWYRPEGDSPYWEIIKEAHIPELPDLTGCYPSTVVGPLAEKLLRLEVIQVADVDQVEERIWQRFVRSLGSRAVLVIPMQMPSGRIGVISCSHTTEPHSWTDDEIALLQAVMGQMAIALNQADLYAQTRTKAQELEKTLAELRRTQSQMVQNEKMSSLGQLVAGIAHEINNPVNFIYGNLSHAHVYTEDLLGLIRLYQQHYPTTVPQIEAEVDKIDLDFVMEDLPKLLASIQAGAERIQGIVRSLRNFSRMDEAEKKSVSIHDGLDSTLMILQNRLKKRGDHPGIEIIKEYGNLPRVECYAGQLNQVFMNILVNAIDVLEESLNLGRVPLAESLKSAQATLQGNESTAIYPTGQQTLDATQKSLPTIWIRTATLGRDRVQITIADNGPGMTESQRQRLFDPFFTTKPVGKGTGLGLSISYQVVVDRHGGQLSCRSAPGQGAEFQIEIPIRQA